MIDFDTIRKMTDDEILSLLIQIYHIGHKDEHTNRINSFKALNEGFTEFEKD